MKHLMYDLRFILRNRRLPAEPSMQRVSIHVNSNDLGDFTIRSNRGLWRPADSKDNR